MNCRRCELACYIKNAGTNNIFETLKLTDPPTKNIELIQVAGTSMPSNCRHCDEPLCVDVCKPGALYIDQKNKIKQKEEKNEKIFAFIYLHYAIFLDELL